MSTLKVNAVIDASGGNTATINSMTPTAGSLQGFRNRIINGDMRIDQRNAGASVTPGAGGFNYTIDRFAAYVSQSSKLTVQQSTTAPVGFTSSLKVTSSSAYSVLASDLFLIEQPIEGLNVSDLAWGTANAKTVTLSFQVYSSLTGTFGGSILNSGANRSYPFTYTVSSANTWTSISVTIPGDTTGTWLTTNGIGMYVSFGLGVGSTFSGTAGSWAGSQYWSATGATSVVGTNAATWYITGVQLEVGSVATPFERRPYGTELALCQRYFETSDGVIWSSTGYHTSFIRAGQPLLVTKRAAPTVTFTNVLNSGGGVVSISSSNTKKSHIGWQADGQGTSFGLEFSYTASAEL